MPIYLRERERKREKENKQHQQKKNKNDEVKQQETCLFLIPRAC